MFSLEVNISILQTRNEDAKKWHKTDSEVQSSKPDKTYKRKNLLWKISYITKIS